MNLPNFGTEPEVIDTCTRISSSRKKLPNRLVAENHNIYHEMTAGLTLDDISSIPFREQWFHGGRQTFEELEEI